MAEKPKATVSYRGKSADLDRPEGAKLIEEAIEDALEASK